MLHQVLLVAHITVLGYWLGAELVINSSFRFVSRARGIPFVERDRLLDHVLDVDQHVRYALVLQAGLGTALAALAGYLPGGVMLAIGAGIGGIAWLALVEVTHRWRKTRAGPVLARVDNAVRVTAMLVLLALTGLGIAGAPGALPAWLAVKLGLFAGVIACGMGIRLAIMRYYRAWHEVESRGSTPVTEALVMRDYWQATATLLLLWACIGGIVVLSVLRP